jgi:hypothetical protein
VYILTTCSKWCSGVPDNASSLHPLFTSPTHLPSLPLLCRAVLSLHLQKAVDLVFQTMPHQVNILGNFMDNHDMPRMAAYEAANEDIIL